MIKKLTIEEAYVAMFIFLNDHYKIHQDDYLSVLLSGMAYTVKGIPFDMGNISRWKEAIEKVKNLEADRKLQIKKELTLDEAYMAMFLFLDAYKLSKKNYLDKLLHGMELTSEGVPRDKNNLEMWSNAIEKAQKNEKDITLVLSALSG